MTSRIAALLVAAVLVAATASAQEAVPGPAPAPEVPPAALPATVPIAAALHVEPNACFDAASLAEVLSHWLQRGVLDRRIEVEVAGQPGSPEGLVLRVRREGQIVGERRFPSFSAPCDEVRSAVGLAAALAVDATTVESLGVKPAPLVPPEPPHGIPAPPPSPSAPAPAASTLGPGFSASIEAVGLFGVVPAPVAAFAPVFGVRPIGAGGVGAGAPSPWLELRFTGLVTAAGALGLGTRSVDVSLLAGRADACAAFALSIVRLRGCAGVAAGRLQAATTGPSASLSPSAPWGAAIGRADGRISVRPWLGFVLGAEAIFPFTRPSFEVVTPAGTPVVASGLPAFGGAVTVGPELTFR